MIGFNNQHMIHNGEPWFPVMGEMHYSRTLRAKWRESLMKMKAGGITVASTYVIWIHHEEVEGEVDFSGNKDLKAFLQVCKECGLYMFLRIGPWCHGEVRNGGFPDWLLRYDTRSNCPDYFKQVERFYELIFNQAQEYLYKDGGPVIGVQIENEFGHCGGLSGEEGEEHMRRLTEIAMKTGFEVPLYTATGWGGAVTGGLLPVMGGYCDAPWAQEITELEPSGNFVFTHERNDHNIGSDYNIGMGNTFDSKLFPYITAELGGGLQVTRHRRPVATGRDIGAKSLAKLGSGANFLGYYMYHGGTNPKGKLTTLQETRASGSYNDLPELNYDFRAPIGEYGQLNDSFKEIKLLAMFLADFGSDFAKMATHIPQENPLAPNNLTDLRWSVRHNCDWGFLFVNNYVRRRKMANHQDVTLNIEIDGKKIETTPFDVEDGEFFFYPLDMPVHGGVIKWATATPLCVDGSTTIFYGKEDAVFITEGEPDYRLISREEAMNAYKCDDKLIISQHPVIEDENGWIMLKTENVDGHCECEEFSPGKYYIKLNYPRQCDNWFLTISYHGESARLYLDGELIADDFYAGVPWVIGLSGFDFPKEIELIVETLYENDEIYLEKWPEMKCGEINSVDFLGLSSETRMRA